MASIGEFGPSSVIAQLGDLGGDWSLMRSREQGIFHALGRPGAFGLLMDRVDVALQLGPLVAGSAKLLLDSGFLGAQFLDRRCRAAVIVGRDLVRAIP